MKKIILLFIVLTFFKVTGQCDDTLPIMDNFDTNQIGVCWQVDDADGDGYDWYWREYLAIYGGYKCLVSRSYNTADGALTPDNWVKSYPIDLTSFSTSDNIQLSWKVRGEYSNLSHEYYSVYAATNNQISDFTSSPVVTSEYADAVGGTGTFVTRSMDISSLGGNTVYIAFRHHNSSNQYSINIDDVSISTSLLSNTDFDVKSFKHFYDLDNDSLILKSDIKLDNVSIYNMLGQQVLLRKLSKNRETINVSNLKDGIYIANVEIDNTFQTVKFIKR